MPLVHNLDMSPNVSQSMPDADFNRKILDEASEPASPDPLAKSRMSRMSSIDAISYGDATSLHSNARRKRRRKSTNVEDEAEEIKRAEERARKREDEAWGQSLGEPFITSYRR